MSQIEKSDYEVIEQTDNYTLIKFNRNPNRGFNFEFEMYVPACIREDANLLVTYDYNPAKIGLLVERLGAPIMRPHIKKIKGEDGTEVNFEQLDPKGILDENGERVLYLESEVDGEQCKTTILEQYRAAFDTAYAYLKQEGIIAEDKTEKVDIEGYSYQGVIAQRMGMLLPDRVRSVICGGAISSIPIPKKSYMGTKLPYPTGIENIEDILGITPQEYLESYKKVIQILYATEEELKYDGKYTEAGERVERDSLGNRVDKTKLTVSQHDMSPEVIDTVLAQREMFGDDLNERIMGAIELCEELGCAMKKLKIYKGTGHHISDPAICEQTIIDMCAAVSSMDEAEKAGVDLESAEIRGYDLDKDNNGNPIVRIDTSYDDKRRTIQTRLARTESDEEYEDTIDEILIELATDPVECRKFLFITDMGGGKKKVFINELSPERIRKAIELVRESKRSRVQVLGIETLPEQKDNGDKEAVAAEMLAHEKTREQVKISEDPNQAI